MTASLTEPTLSPIGELPAAKALEVRGWFGRFARDPIAVGATCIIALFLGAGLLAPWIAPYSPTAVNVAQSLAGPSGHHWFGTDVVGRDELTLILYGARLSLLITVASVAAGLIVGVLLGLIAGMRGGWLDSVIMRVIDVWLSIPGILLAIGVVAVFGTGLPQITFAVSATQVPIYARILRARIQEVAATEYVTATRVIGASELRLFARHILPNSSTPVIVAALLSMSSAIVNVAGLGFLGLGPANRGVAEWGTELTNAADYMRTAPYLVLFPSVAIVLCAVSFNLIGDGLELALDPRRG